VRYGERQAAGNWRLTVKVNPEYLKVLIEEQEPLKEAKKYCNFLVYGEFDDCPFCFYRETCLAFSVYELSRPYFELYCRAVELEIACHRQGLACNVRGLLNSIEQRLEEEAHRYVFDRTQKRPELALVANQPEVPPND
jgi:hypothetical protein